jgi:ribosomal protein S18 acetylase RimI-like enzyme
MAPAMTSLPVPPVIPGLTWRPWSLGDIDALIRHVLRVHEAERLDHVAGAESYRWFASQEGIDPATDTLIACDASGEVRAEASVFSQVTDLGGRVFLSTEAAPPFTHLRPYLIAWAEARARQILAAVPLGLDRVIRSGVEEHRGAFRKELEDAGLELARSFATMRRSLSDLPAPPPLPAGVSVEPWSAERDEATRLANNESFADHWGTFPMSEQMWASSYRESETFRPDLSFVAVASEGVVSFCMVEVEEHENARTGHREVYIQRVGTLRTHRRQRLASHLMLRTLQAAAAQAMDRAALDVDESSHTNAGDVYLRLGFAVRERSIHYLKQA